ncbi:MAG TPA: MFS transporter [Streptosporangiaceae bacterium]|nr:MFS transporter [Streptosporangiaceae bacterium]
MRGPAAVAARDPHVIETERPVALWRNLQFQALWLSQAASSLGSGVADVAYPLAILALTGSPARAGLFAAVQTAGLVAGALPGGQLADVCDRRAIVVAAESARALITTVVVVGLIMGWLSLPVLIAAGALLGVGQSVSGAARLPLVRSVVPASQLTSALTQDEVRQNGAALAGPPLAGALYGIRALAHAAPFLFSAAAFILSALGAVATKLLPPGPDRGARSAGEGACEPDDAAAKPRARGKGGMLVGLRTLWANPVLRAAMLLITLANAVGVGLDLVVIVILRDQRVPSAQIGMVLAAMAVGGLAGAPLVKPLHRIRPGVLLLGVCAIEVPMVAGLALPFGPWWVAALLFVPSLGVPALRVLLDVLIFRQTPDDQRGRVVAAVMTMMAIGMPAGLALTGALLQWLPERMALLTLAAILALSVLYCGAKRDLWRARWPQQGAE